MIEEDYQQGWRQHFPTYDFQNRDIALEEYKVAAKNLESEERVFLNASNLTMVTSAALGSLLVGYSNQLTYIFDNIIPSYIISAILLSIIISFTFISFKYFADRQRTIVFAARKVIILRRMLGLNYGGVQLVLPNWRVEGADQPFALKLFPGWFTYAAYPFWIISIISSTVILFLSSHFLQNLPSEIPKEQHWLFILLIVLSWFLISLFIFRISLLDTHERVRLLFYKKLSKVIRLRLTQNIEYIIYRAHLATHETNRNKINTKKIKKFLVFIEDKNFYSHSGISYKSLARSLLGLVKNHNAGGGSTIAQQLIRTLFIKDLNKKFRRKFIELSLAPWLVNIFTKDMILDIYISSVRYERGCFGVIKAMKHFWGQVIANPTSAHAFFLVERVSNIKSKLLVNKIIDTAKAAKAQNILNDTDLKLLEKLYTKAVQDKKIIATHEDLSKLIKGIQNIS